MRDCLAADVLLLGVGGAVRAAPLEAQEPARFLTLMWRGPRLGSIVRLAAVLAHTLASGGRSSPRV